MSNDKFDFNFTNKNIELLECEDITHEDINICVNNTGRLVCVTVITHNVRCNRMLAIGVLLFDGGLIKGFKAVEVYTGSCRGNKYNRLCNYKKTLKTRFFFVIANNDMLGKHFLQVKTIAHYTNLNM